MRSSFTVLGDPVPKPRQTVSDRWNKRPSVVRYRAWCDEARKAAGIVEKAPCDCLGLYCFAYFEVPKGAPERAGRVHRQTPDCDNCLKALMDAIFEDDSKVAFAVCQKFWCDVDEEPRVDVILVRP